MTQKHIAMIKNMAGKKIYRWTVLSQSPIRFRGAVQWLCRCECGTKKLQVGVELRRGKSKSCGCFSKERKTTHGQTHTRLYRIYAGIVTRCTNKKATHYAYYGGRGIKNKWKSFKEFYKDMRESYDEHVRRYGVHSTTIDRIDNNKHYSRNNCRWATRREQMKNSSLYIQAHK